MAKQSLIPHPLPVLISRPAPQASRFAQTLPPGLLPIISPLMRTDFVRPALPDVAFQALILTSETGARAAARLQPAHPLPRIAFCVGDRTAAEAEAQGFTPLSAAGDAADLARLILSHPNPGRMLYLHGADRAADLSARLAGQRQITSVIGYQQQPCPLTPEATDLLSRDGPVLLPMFSPRSSRLMRDALPEHTAARLVPVTISANTTAALPPALARLAFTALHPNAASLTDALKLAAFCLLSGATA